MDLRKILNEIGQADTQVYEKLSGRREVLKSFGAKVAAAALPLAAGSLFTKAYGRTTSSSVIVDSLNFLLELEYFQYNYFHTGNNTGNLIPAADLPGFLTIEAQQKAHITFLIGAITNLNAVPYTPPNYNAGAANPYYIVSGAYDFTAGATYQSFSNYSVFLTLAQVFTDTAVHGYKGQIPTIVANATLLTQYMELQCAEARHAAHVRFVRRSAGAPENPAPWITNNIPPTIPLQPFYNGEDNVGQMGVDISSLPDTYAPGGVVPMISATAAFDQSLNSPTILSLLKPFML